MDAFFKELKERIIDIGSDGTSPPMFADTQNVCIDIIQVVLQLVRMICQN